MRYRFVDKYNYGSPYIYIHPYKQHVVKTIVDNTFPEISQIIVFGSSITTACKPYSDVDICVIGDFDDEHLSSLRVRGEAIDITHFKTVGMLLQDSRLADEVKKGVRVHG